MKSTDSLASTALIMAASIVWLASKDSLTYFVCFSVAFRNLYPNHIFVTRIAHHFDSISKLFAQVENCGVDW